MELMFITNSLSGDVILLLFVSFILTRMFGDKQDQ